MNILIVDTLCNKDYDPDVLKTSALGGTEATVIRIAEAMGRQGHSVIVAQHGTRSPRVYANTAYCSFDFIDRKRRWDAVISIRSAAPLVWLKDSLAGNPLLNVWYHDLPGTWLAEDRGILAELKPQVVCVSQFHKTRVQEFLRGFYQDIGQYPKVNVIYNPIDDGLVPDNTPVDKNKLTFFSSPHKGLANTLVKYRNVKRNFLKDLTLYIGNPGYVSTSEVNHMARDGIVILGSLPHHEIMRHVRSSLCVFYPNHVFPETFGLVMAEANAVGTPVLTHRLGAAMEVLNPYDTQLVDCTDPKAVFDRLRDWYRNGRTKVEAKPEFRTTEVTKQWIALLSRH